MYQALLISILLILFFQDMRNRSVHWILFPLLLVFSVLIGKESSEYVQWSYSLLFLVVLLLSLTLYLSLKSGSLVNITDGFFSWGDILFLLAIIPLFDLSTYMLFFTFGTIATLLFHLLAHVFKAQKTVPYAGYMSVVCVFYVLFQQTIIHFTSGLI